MFSIFPWKSSHFHRLSSAPSKNKRGPHTPLDLARCHRAASVINSWSPTDSVQARAKLPPDLWSRRWWLSVFLPEPRSQSWWGPASWRPGPVFMLIVPTKPAAGTSLAAHAGSRIDLLKATG